MNAPLHDPPAVRTDLPLLRRRLRRARRGRTGSGGAVDRRRSRPSGEFRQALLEGLGARRDARARRPAAASDAAAGRRQRYARIDWDTALRQRRRTASPHHRARRAGRGRVLSLRPVADRGLLRRQQADEGLPRLGQCRHQFAAVHGLVGRRPSPRLRRRHGAGHLRGSRRGRSDRAGRLERRLVPSGAVSAHGAQPARARRQDRGDRSAPHRDREEADLFLPIAPGIDTALFCGLLVHLADARRARSTRISTRTPRGFADGAGARARDRARCRRDRRARPASTQGDVARFFDLFRATARVVTCFSQGVNQSAQGTDKVNAIINCHLATGRIGRPGMGPFSLTGQPNAMGGREVGGLANQLAAHMGFAPERYRPRARASGMRRAWRSAKGLKAVQMFEAIERGEIKALWVMATNPAVSLPRAGAVREALEEARTVRRLRERALERHGQRPARMCCCRPRPGARRTAPSPIPSGASRASARSCRCRARRRPDWWIVARGGAAHGLRRRVRLSHRPPMCSASTRRCRPSRTTARAISISAGSRRSRTRNSTRSSRCNGRCARAKHGPIARFFADGGFFTPDRKARFIAPERPALQETTVERVSAAAQHRPRARPVAHHDAHRPEPAARRASAGAVRRSASGRCAQAHGLSDGGFARVATPHGACVAQGRRQRRPAAGLAVRADPLERRDRLVGARRRSGRAATDPLFRPAGGQGDAGRDRAGRILRYRGFVAYARAPVALAGGHLVGARRDGRRHRIPARDQRRPDCSGTTSRYRLLGARCEACRISRRSARHLSRRGLRRRRARRLPVRRTGRRAAAMGHGRSLAAGRWPPTARIFACCDASAKPPMARRCGTGRLRLLRRRPERDPRGRRLRRRRATSPRSAQALRAGTNCGSCLPELKRIVAHERIAQPV